MTEIFNLHLGTDVRNSVACPMLYRLNLVVNDTTVKDEVGVELPDIEAACFHAMADARYIIAEEAKNNREPPDWSIEIVDQDGTYLATVEFADVATLH